MRLVILDATCLERPRGNYGRVEQRSQHPLHDGFRVEPMVLGGVTIENGECQRHIRWNVFVEYESYNREEKNSVITRYT